MAWSITTVVVFSGVVGFSLGAASVGVPWLYTAYQSQRERADNAETLVEDNADTREKIVQSRLTYDQGVEDARRQAAQADRSGCPLDSDDLEYLGVFRTNAEKANARAASRSQSRAPENPVR